MKKRNEFKTISESEVICWAMFGLCERMNEIARLARYYREEGKPEKAEAWREEFNRCKDQYLEIFRATYVKESHDIALDVVRKAAKLGWGDEKK